MDELPPAPEPTLEEIRAALAAADASVIREGPDWVVFWGTPNGAEFYFGRSSGDLLTRLKEVVAERR